MSAPFPSIQTFYSREVPQSSPNENESSNTRNDGDGFTPSEVEAALDPLSQPWKPSRFYEPCPIARLESGPHNYHISGRLVNFSTTPGGHPRTQTASEAHYFLVIADGTGAIAIKLYYHKASDYQLLLGQRIEVWTGYIADSTKAEVGNIPFCAAATTIYPGRNGATHIIFHSDAAGSDGDRSLRCPLEVGPERYDYLPGLMTLKAFVSTGYDLGEGKILVCVRSIGTRRTVHTKKRNSTLDLVEVGIFDDTATCVLKLWEDKVASAKTWVPNHTLLLISSPTCRFNEQPNIQDENSPDIGIGYSSMVDVDPDFPEAEWLRKKVKDMSKKDSIHIPFPSQTWDINLAGNGPKRTLFTVADVEEQVRHQDPVSDFTGKMNVIILETSLMEHWRKGTACCLECCKIPLYANKPVATCKNCGVQRNLSLNPRIISSMIDESGAMAGGKLVWNDDAWTQLLFGDIPEDRSGGSAEKNLVKRSWEDITALDNNSLRGLEEKLLYSRATLTFGWSSDLGRLCILGVEW